MNRKIVKHRSGSGYPKTANLSLSRAVIGRQAVKIAIAHSPTQIQSLLISERISAEGTAAEILKSAQECGILISTVSDSEITSRAESTSHQGFCALMLNKEPLSSSELIHDLADTPLGIVVVVDCVSDPQNMGSIIRAAECFGVQAVAYAGRRTSPISAVVAKASAGAAEVVSLCEVTNIADLIERLKNLGYWIVAADVSDGAVPLSKFTFPEKTVLILGSEGQGVRRLLRDRADFRLYIPMYGVVDSLNVSQAAAVLLSHYRCQHPS